MGTMMIDPVVLPSYGFIQGFVEDSKDTGALGTVRYSETVGNMKCVLCHEMHCFH